MYISGIGIVFTRGRGIDSFEKALKEGWREPSWGVPIPAYRVGQETLTDASLSKKIRRADRFSRMAVISAVDAYRDSGITVSEKNKLGIILSTAFGPHTTTFSFIDDILDYGDASVSPTKFSNSVHNAAASYISSILESRGPTVTLTHFKFAFQHALILADLWLSNGRCDHVLCGCAEELGTVMEYACRMKINIAKDGKIKPFDFSDSPVSVPGEGSVFIMLSKEKGGNNYGKVDETSFSQKITGHPDFFVIDADGMNGDETGYKELIGYDAELKGYSPIFGSMPTGSAFNFAAASLMLKNQVAYNCVFQDNPLVEKLCVETSAKNLNEIYCVKSCRSGINTVVKLQK
jgi:3-oxoacyl-[acyl-carrier-protein] synthase II